MRLSVQFIDLRVSLLAGVSWCKVICRLVFVSFLSLDHLYCECGVYIHISEFLLVLDFFPS